MKILFASRTKNVRTAGVAKIMNCLRDELILLGHEVDILFARDVPEISFSRRLSDLFFPILLFFAIKKKWKHEKWRHDIVALHSTAAFFYVAMRLLDRSLPPCVTVSYGSDEMRWELEKEEARLGLRPLRFISKLFYFPLVVLPARFATKHADHVMVAARSEIQFYQSRYQLAPEHITFVPNGVSPNYFIKRKYSPAPRKLLFLGGWEWRKGIRYLVESFCLLSKEYPDLTLSVVGVGEGEKEVLLSFPQEVQSKITVIGNVGEQETIRIYESHDIFVFPSLFESMSLVVPEAMATAMPVITTRACGMQDIIEDQVSGFLVSPRNTLEIVAAVKKIIDNPALAESLGKAAQQTAQMLLWSRIADQTLNIYKSTLWQK